MISYYQQPIRQFTQMHETFIHNTLETFPHILLRIKIANANNTTVLVITRGNFHETLTIVCQSLFEFAYHKSCKDNGFSEHQSWYWIRLLMYQSRVNSPSYKLQYLHNKNSYQYTAYRSSLDMSTPMEGGAVIFDLMIGAYCRSMCLSASKPVRM